MRLALALCLLAATAIPAYADCNHFEAVQQVLLSEGAHQPLPTLIELARVVHTHGDCERDGNFYSGYAIAERVMRDNPGGCIANLHCRAYNLMYAIDPSVREPVALAAYSALVERPAIPRYHFDAASASPAWWWESVEACPTPWFISGDFRIC